VVFLGDGEVLIEIRDASIHARRALFSFVNFPAILNWDPYLAYPTGAPVPMPPLYDWTLAAVARAFGDSLSVFEHVAAWSSPVLAALTVLPVYAGGRIVGGRGVGLGAAAIFALLPVSVMRSRIGDPDHHAAVALLVSLFVLLTLQQTRSRLAGCRLVWGSAAHSLTVAALALTWSGSLFYIGLGEGILLLAGALRADRSLLLGQSAATAAAAAMVAPWVVVAGTPIGGPFSSTTLSWLHVAALTGIALVAGVLALGEAWRPSQGTAARLVRSVAVAGAGLALLLAILPISSALGTGLSFLAKGDSWAARNIEQQPLFDWAASGFARVVGPALLRYGYFAYAIPLAWLAALARARDRSLRVPALCLAGWILVVGTMAVLQRRFGSDFAPIASIGFALLFGEFKNVVPRVVPRPIVSLLAVLVGAGLLWPGSMATDLWKAPEAASRLFHPGESLPAGYVNPSHALVDFLRMVRQVTPETSGYFDPEETPEYGVLIYPGHGHAMAYVGRRPTPANNFASYLDSEKYTSVLRFFHSRSVRKALAIVDRLSVRYVVTHDRHTLKPGEFAHLLHRKDGSGRIGRRHAERFRLIIEGPEGGQPLSTSFPRGAPPGVIPYKLFEVVKGAVFEVRGDPGTPIRAEVSVVTPTGRRFEYRAAAPIGDDGIARLRVPYATETSEPTKPEGPYRVWIEAAEVRVRVTDADVREGALIRLTAPSPADGPG
jgi:dolichyl-diphosphooligosaccharide--protein glycosyltransferase